MSDNQKSELVLVHPFEKTLGPGPFAYVGGYDMGAALAHQQAHGSTEAAFRYAPKLEAGMGTCAHCGHAILNICIVRRGDGKLYGVGSDCILKIGDAKLISAVRLEKNRINREKNAAKREVQRAARVKAERERNGGLMDWEVKEKKRQEEQAAHELAMQPIIALLEPFAAALADGKGGFRDSVARDMRGGHIPSGRGLEITIDILAKNSGRAGSKAYEARARELQNQFDKITSAKG